MKHNPARVLHLKERDSWRKRGTGRRREQTSAQYLEQFLETSAQHLELFLGILVWKSDKGVMIGKMLTNRKVLFSAQQIILRTNLGT